MAAKNISMSLTLPATVGEVQDWLGDVMRVFDSDTNVQVAIRDDCIEVDEDRDA